MRHFRKAGKITYMRFASLFLSGILMSLLVLDGGCSLSGNKGPALQEIAFPTPTVQPFPTQTPGAVTVTAAEPTPTDTPEPLEYVVEEAKGTVLLVQNGNPQPVALEEEEMVQQGDEIITKEDSQATLSLDENTLIRLGPDSDLHINALAPNETNGFISLLELAGGKIMSDVEHLADRQSSFEVTSGGVVCGVRGTAFEVEKQGQEVQTNTFRGVVEMKKDHYVQKVKANEHLAFSFRKKSFLGKRKVNSQEMGNYHAWNAKLGGYQKKARERRNMMESLNRLSPEDKSRILRQMKQVPPRQRFKALRHAVHPGNVISPGHNTNRLSGNEKPSQRQAPLLKKLNRPMTQVQNRGGNGTHQEGNQNGHSPMFKGNDKRPLVKSKPQIRHPQYVTPNAPKKRGPKREFHVQHPQNNHAPIRSRPPQNPKAKRKKQDTEKDSKN